VETVQGRLEVEDALTDAEAEALLITVFLATCPCLDPWTADCVIRAIRKATALRTSFSGKGQARVTLCKLRDSAERALSDLDIRGALPQAQQDDRSRAEFWWPERILERKVGLAFLSLQQALECHILPNAMPAPWNNAPLDLCDPCALLSAPGTMPIAML
jgi:hypothetical protein